MERKKKKKRNKPADVRERHRYKGGGIMVWAGMILNGRIDLHILINATVYAEIYRDEVPDPPTKLFRGAIVNNFLLMDDNMRLDRAELVTDYFEGKGIK